MENNKKIEVGLGLTKGGISALIGTLVASYVLKYTNDATLAQASLVVTVALVIALGKALRRFTKIDLKVI